MVTFTGTRVRVVETDEEMGIASLPIRDFLKRAFANEEMIREEAIVDSFIKGKRAGIEAAKIRLTAAMKGL